MTATPKRRSSRSQARPPYAGRRQVAIQGAAPRVGLGKSGSPMHNIALHARLIEQLRDDLADPKLVCHHLGLLEGARRQLGGYVVRCPAHEDRTPSCSVRCVNGTLFFRCFACGARGDVFGLIAAVHDLDQREFPAIVARAKLISGREARLSGHGDASARRGPNCVRVVGPAYPPEAEVLDVWSRASAAADASDVAAWLRGRGLNVGAVTDYGLCRQLPAGCLPPWARIRNQPWSGAGYVMVFPTFDGCGQLRSLRAGRLDDGSPKRVAPRGYSTAGLVMADALAASLLSKRGEGTWWQRPCLRVLITEGEPDFLTWASAPSDADEDAPAVFGLVSGSWTPEMGAAIPPTSKVIIRTHLDLAGHRYAGEVAATLAYGIEVVRLGAT